MHQRLAKCRIDFLSQACHMHVDDIVQRHDTGGFVPDVAHQHFARDDAALTPSKILEQLKFLAGQLDRLAGPRYLPSRYIHFQIGKFQFKGCGRIALSAP